MRLPLSLVAAAASVATAAQFDCKAVEVDGQKFNFEALKGPHTVVTTEYAPPSYYNRTYTIDLCAPLKRKGDVDARFRCPDGTHVCQIKHHWDTEKKKSEVEEVIPVAGDLEKHGGGQFAYETTRLKTEGEDKTGSGVKVTLKGGKYEQRDQKAVIEFRCKKGTSGLDGEWESEDEYAASATEDKKESDEMGFPERQLKKNNAALIWEGYKREGDVDTLFLTWHTERACMEAGEVPPISESSHWGFFTWFILLLFLGIAAYLIFGSWLNYSRYGARGWDLLPHGDTLRDVPYLLKDFTRRVLNTVQSSGSRGGYSAV